MSGCLCLTMLAALCAGQAPTSGPAEFTLVVDTAPYVAPPESMTVAAGESHLLNVCVRPERQREGHGMRLLEHLVALSRRHHADTALLEVRPSNRAALALYRKAGFNEVGVRRGYYPGTNGREDALILARHLEPTPR
jgi:ribosomal-protein-alanine acetyltransferase